MAAKVADLLRCIVDPLLDNPPAATPGKLTRMWQITLSTGMLLLGGQDSRQTPAVCVTGDSVHSAAVTWTACLSGHLA